MNNLIFISGYTTNTLYEKQINEVLIPSFKKLNLKYWIKPFESLGKWQKNSSNKINIIIEALNTFSEDIVWIDADACIWQYPSLLFEISEDLGFHILSWDKHFGGRSNRLELLDGTLFVRNNDKTKLLLEELKLNMANITSSHRPVLEKLLTKHPEITCFNLPWAYCYISTCPHGKTHHPIDNPVVEHYQLSRVARKIINSIK